MRMIIGFVMAIAVAGCGDGDSAPNDLSLCPTIINEGDPCPPVDCHLLGDHCSCGANNKWTCSHPDMTTPHD
jgi:hypothetical protein